jgi:hypothetical protein
LKKIVNFWTKFLQIAQNSDYNIDPWSLAFAGFSATAEQPFSPLPETVSKRSRRKSTVARWIIFKPKIPIWVNFGRA